MKKLIYTILVFGVGWALGRGSVYDPDDNLKYATEW